ncbi:unnamed protein product [Thelazia callipaeda]|uniref:DB domain-containing protein n=1 Tax=Thelazia callipaeda TaxID=103827 RepID=A0A0N5CJY6_THECL|nr:unnamed protein product [Thelazia callipaeda]
MNHKLLFRATNGEYGADLLMNGAGIYNQRDTVNDVSNRLEAIEHTSHTDAITSRSAAKQLPTNRENVLPKRRSHRIQNQTHQNHRYHEQSQQFHANTNNRVEFAAGLNSRSKEQQFLCQKSNQSYSPHHEHTKFFAETAQPVIDYETSRDTSKVKSKTLSPRPPLHFVPPYFLERVSKIQPISTHVEVPRLPTVTTIPILSSSLSLSGQLKKKLPLEKSTSTRLGTQAVKYYSGKFPKRLRHLLTNFKNGNDAFLKCCKDRAVDVSCESRCNFEVLNRRVLTTMLLGADSCPQSNGRKLLSCAAQDTDHTYCCRANGVQKTTAGDKCLQFCKMSPGFEMEIDISMLPCWSVLEKIKKCFRLGLMEKYRNWEVGVNTDML